MLLEKQKNNPNKMTSNPNLRNLQNDIGKLQSEGTSQISNNVRFALFVLVSMLFIFPTGLLLILLGHIGVLSISTIIVVFILFVVFYIMIIHSIFQIMRYYLNPLSPILNSR
jgi:hypothetical protein